MKTFAKKMFYVILFLLIIDTSLTIIQNTVRRYQTEKSLDEAINYAMHAAYKIRDAYYFKPDYSYETTGYEKVDFSGMTEAQIDAKKKQLADAFTTNAGKKMLAEFNKQLLGQINGSASALCVKVITIDPDRGLMDIQAEEKFLYPNGKTGTIRIRRTMEASITGSEY